MWLYQRNFFMKIEISLCQDKISVSNFFCKNIICHLFYKILISRILKKISFTLISIIWKWQTNEVLDTTETTRLQQPGPLLPYVFCTFSQSLLCHFPLSPQIIRYVGLISYKKCNPGQKFRNFYIFNFIIIFIYYLIRIFVI